VRHGRRVIRVPGRWLFPDMVEYHGDGSREPELLTIVNNLCLFFVDYNMQKYLEEGERCYIFVPTK